MTIVRESSTRRRRFMVYGIVAAALVILLVVALFAGHSARSTRTAQTKADQLTAALRAVGARAPSHDQIVRVLGDDGGAICADPNGALNKATLLAGLANGAGGPGTRPVVADSRLVKGETLVISVYCPDKLAGFQQFVTGIRTGNVASG